MSEVLDLIEIPIKDIEADTQQPRKDFQKIEDLIYSIMKYGILEPLKVVEIGDNRYRLIDGERRYRALSRIIKKQCGFEEKVKCFVLSKITNKLILQLVTDIHKQKLNPIEEANSFKELIKRKKMSIDEVRVLIGKPREYVVKRLKLIAFNISTQKKIKEGKISPSIASSISIGTIKEKEDIIISRIEEEKANMSRAKEIIYEEENRESSRINLFSSSIESTIENIKNFIYFLKKIEGKKYKGVSKAMSKIKVDELQEKLKELNKIIRAEVVEK